MEEWLAILRETSKGYLGVEMINVRAVCLAELLLRGICLKERTEPLIQRALGAGGAGKPLLGGECQRAVLLR